MKSKQNLSGSLLDANVRLIYPDSVFTLFNNHICTHGTQFHKIYFWSFSILVDKYYYSDQYIYSKVSKNVKLTMNSQYQKFSKNAL